MPNRVTLWRWAKRGHRPANNLRSGRRLKRTTRDALIRKKLQALLHQRLGMCDNITRRYLLARDPISSRAYPIDLMAVAVNDHFHLARRTRRVSSKSIVHLLKNEYPHLGIKECERLAASGGDWLNEFKGSTTSQPRWRLDSGRNSPSSISRLLPISRRMECYWRKHSDYESLRACFRFLDQFAGKMTGDRRLTEREEEAERRLRKGASPSSWIAPRFLRTK